MTVESSQSPSIQERMNSGFVYFRLHRRGNQNQLNTLLHQEINERTEDLQNRTSQLATSMLERSAVVESTVKELADEMESADFLRAGEFQTENLTQMLHELQNQQKVLKDQYQSTEKQLLQQKEDKKVIQPSLEHLSDKLKKPALPYNEQILMLSQDLCTYLSR